jgi:hypothetical protein
LVVLVNLGLLYNYCIDVTISEGLLSHLIPTSIRHDGIFTKGVIKRGRFFRFLEIHCRKGGTTMYVIASTTYPLKSTMDAAKAFIESLKEPLPDFVTRMGVYVCYGGKGIKGLSLYDIKEGKEAEGYKELAKMLTRFYDVEGYQVTLEWVLTAEEALPLIGLEA